ncbi:hypothetical protein V492_05039 [Pseudogymnoascus sp. VKM F-4246]|nr:hypothetical protein V492_05039 [Pseudogymnoascus sp. VKM F-4246]
MPKDSLIDGIKRRFQSRSPARKRAVTEGPSTGAPQAPEPSIDATQSSGLPSIAQIPAESVSPPDCSGPSDTYPEKYGLFRVGIPTADSLAEDSRPDTNSIDIVVVHGLNGTSHGTWTHENGNLWLEDLAKDFPGARVFTYGYASEIYFTRGTGNIGTFSLGLLNDLKGGRISKTDQARPIIFICHSMGGIVVKNALITAKLDDRDFGTITKSVVGIAFLATPHRGSSQAEFPALLASAVNITLTGTSRYVGSMRSDLIKSLEKDSEGLNDISTNFRNQMRDIKIASFTEQDKMPPANKLIVDGFSGIMGIPDERIVPMHGSESKVTTLEDLSCLRSLSFLEINYRRQEADQAYENTCAWILKNAAYIEWLEKNCELLWIQGSPGSGKSTLMSFIYNEAHKNFIPGREVFLAYFFHGRGTILQKTRVGMFRTLLHQLYDQVHFIRPQIRKVFEEKEKFGSAGTGWEWHVKECESLFSEVIVCAARSRTITLFVDALDEAGADGSELASYFHELNAKLRARNCNARICISCRKYPVIAPNICLKVYVEKENTRDIKTYVDQRFDSEIQSHGMANSAQKDFKKLQMAVVERSQNTFQWACLVVRLIFKLRRDGQPLDYIMKELNKVPQGLDEVYEHILTKVVEFQYRPKTLLLMQWVCLANNPLSVESIRFAMASDDAYVDELGQSYSNSKDFVRSDKDMETLIISMSGGLVETIHYKYGGSRVQFIHQSINDFLLSGGLNLVQHPGPTTWDENDISSSADNIIGQSHDRLCKACINCLKLGDIVLAYDVDGYGGIINRPFVRYAQHYWSFHAERANSYKISQQYLSQRLGLRPHQLFLENISIPTMNLFAFEVDGLISSLLHIAAIENISSVAIEVLKIDPSMVNYQDSANRKPLYYAVLFGHAALVEVLLDADDTTSANIDTEVFRAAVRGGNKLIVRQLLGYGADVRGETLMAGNALITAVKSISAGDVSLIKLLLDHGANANARGDNNNTAIAEAITSLVVHTAVIKLLLENGANPNSRLDSAIVGQKLCLDGLYGPKELSFDNNSVEPLEPCATVLQFAASLKDEHTAFIVTKLLLEKGAHANERGTYGTAIQIASRRHVSVVELLHQNGANVNDLAGNPLTPLQEASSQGNLAVVEFLLEKGACVNLGNEGYPPALQFASDRQDAKLVKVLLDNGANVNTPAGTYGMVLQTLPSRPSPPEVRQLAAQLLQNGMEPKERQLSYNSVVREIVPGAPWFRYNSGPELTSSADNLNDITLSDDDDSSIGGNYGDSDADSS